jgi:aryl-alcohol dehydrogenase-like predicted oxidoreductase
VLFRSQVDQNLKALEVVPKLNEEMMARIETILANQPEPEPNYRSD